MTRLSVNIEKRLPGFELQIELEATAEILVLFGPSGAGKSLTLSAISGLMAPDRGAIRLGDELLFCRGDGAKTWVPARRRNIGHVFQSYALFPHLTVTENVAFSRWPGRGRRAVAREMLDRVQLTHLADRYPDEISGGQQQRVAIARALAAEPEVLLLDEPFSAVDAAVRERLQRDLVALHRQLGLLIIYVTHNLEDAFVMGDRLAVIRDGRVEQIGPIAEVLNQPESTEAAESLAIRNLFTARVARVEPEAVVLDWNGMELEAAPGAGQPGETVQAYVRPEAVKLLYAGRPLIGAVQHNQMEATILEVRAESTQRAVRLRLPNDAELQARFPLHSYVTMGLAVGKQVQISLHRGGVVLLPGGSG